ADRTLFLVDTGTTEAFRHALSAAATQIGPWDRLVVLTTHGHVDHVGNNALADRLGADRGASVRHLVPAPDLPQMRDPLAYWTTAIQRVASMVPGNDNAEERAAHL